MLENQEEFVLNLASLSPLVTVAEDLGSQTVYIIDNERKSILMCPCIYNMVHLYFGHADMMKCENIWYYYYYTVLNPISWCLFA